MNILFDSQDHIEILLHDTPVKTEIEQMYKHLSKVPLPFQPWDNPFFKNTYSLEHIVKSLVDIAKKLQIKIDPQRCLQRDQVYLNELHSIYELKYKGDPLWLDYHDHVHLCELKQEASSLVVDHRHLAGPLIPPMNLDWLKHATLTVRPGDVYVAWTELGKTPYQYWLDNEPDDSVRMCQLAKPWLNFHARFFISLEHRNRLDNIEQNSFNLWWSKRSETWCKHWGLKSWTLEDMNSVIVIGRLDHERLIQILKKPATPIYLTLD